MLEIIATTIEDAREAEAGGANQIELVTALNEGGLTPSYGLIKTVVNHVKIPVSVIIRPKAKGCYYSTDEISLMKEDILVAKVLHVKGVAFGVLDEEESQIDEVNLRELLKVCDGLDVTFSRAIDKLSNPIAAIKTLAKYPQITNVVTSGGRGYIMEKIDVMKELIENSGHIKVFIGGGVRLDNLAEIKEQTKCENYHVATAARENSSLFGDVRCENVEKLVALVEG